MNDYLHEILLIIYTILKKLSAECKKYVIKTKFNYLQKITLRRKNIIL